MDAFSDKKKFYEQRGLECLSVFDKERQIRYDKALKLADVAGNSSILEIGCNECVLYSKLCEKNIYVDYYGIDISQTATSRAGVKSVIIKDITEGIPYESSTFDYIFMLEVLEHIENPFFVVKELTRTLKEDGTLIISVPNPYHWTEVYGNIRRIPETERHILSFTFQTLNSLLECAGLKITDMCGTYVRVPFTRRIFGEMKLFPTDSILTRSYIYKTTKLQHL